MPDVFDQLTADASTDIFDEAAGGDIFDQASVNAPVSTGRGLVASLQRGVKSGLALPDVALAVGARGLDKPTIRQERRAYVDAMNDPEYFLRLSETGSQPQAQRVESAFGPAARLDAAMTPQRELQKSISEDVAKAQSDIAALPKSEAQQRMAAATTGKEKWQAWLKDPFELTAAIVMESLPPAVGGAVLGAAGGPGGIAAGVGASSGLLTFSNEFLGNAQALGYDVKDADSLRKFLNNDDDFQAAFRQAAVKASIIGQVDAATAGAAGQFIEPALKQGLKQVLIAGAKEAGMQAAGGSGGEYVGSLAAGQKPDLFDVAMEGIAEIATGPGEALGNIRQTLKDRGSVSRSAGEKPSVRKTEPVSEIRTPINRVQQSIEELVGRSPKSEAQAPKSAEQAVENLSDAVKDLQATLRGETPESQRLKPEQSSISDQFDKKADLPISQVAPDDQAQIEAQLKAHRGDAETRSEPPYIPEGVKPPPQSSIVNPESEMERPAGATSDAGGLIAGSAAEKWADEVIAQGKQRLHTGLDPELLAAYAVKGAALIESGVRDFAAWSERMVKEFGEAVKPHLDDLFSRSRRRIAGLRAHHGTPHEISVRFSTDKIGTGEGAQTYGWGLYFAENPLVAGEYAKNLGRSSYPSEKNLREYFKPGKIIPAYGGLDRVLELDYQSDGWRVKVEAVKRQPDGSYKAEEPPRWHSTPPTADNLERAGLSTRGNEYSVTLDVKPDELLDWDKPLSEQSERVKSQLNPLLQQADNGYRAAYSKPLPANPSPSAIYFGLAEESESAASRLLLSRGIKGIRYLDQGSRANNLRILSPQESVSGKWVVGEPHGNRSDQHFFDNEAEARAFFNSKQTHNYVIFDDSVVHITHQNTQPVHPVEGVLDRILSGLESLKIKTEGTVQAFGLLPEAWNQLIDLVKLGVRAGRSLRDAIGWAVEKFKSRYPDATLDEKSATEYLLTSEEPEAAKLREQMADERDKGRYTDERADIEADKVLLNQDGNAGRAPVSSASFEEAKTDTPSAPRSPVESSTGWQELRKQLKQASEALRQALHEQSPENRPEGVTRADAQRRTALSTARYRQLRDALIRHPDYVAELVTQHAETLDLLKKMAKDDPQRGDTQAYAEQLRSEMEEVPKKLLNQVYDDLKRRGQIKEPPPKSETALEQETGKAGGEPISQTYSLRDRIAELPEQARALFSSLKRTRQMLANLAARHKNRDMMAYTKDAADNQANIAGRQAGNVVLHELNRAFGAKDLKGLNERDQMREFALTFLVESGISKSGLADARDIIQSSQHLNSAWAKRALRAIEYAEHYFDRLKPVAELYQKLTDAEVQVENEAGIDTLHREGGYVFHMQDLNADWALPDFGGEGGSAGAPFRHMRDHATYADAIAAGVKPRTLNAVDLLARRMTLGRKLVNYRAWMDDLRSVKDPKTELPLVTDTIQRQRADGTVDETAPGGYGIAQLGNQRVALLRGYENIFHALTSPSGLRKSVPGQIALNTVSTAKHLLLVFDSYHLGRLAFWNAVTRRGLPSYRQGVTLLDTTANDIHTMIERGEIPKEWGDSILERKAQISEYLDAGLNVGGISDNVFSHWIEHIPISGNFNRWLFNQYQRGAMTEAALIEGDRMRKAFPELSRSEIARRVARDINVRFGNLKSQGVFKSKLMQDLTRMVFLAPQWNESLIRSEMSAIRQLAQVPVDVAHGRGLRAGTLGLAVGTASLGGFLAAQLINYLTRGKPTWENEEEGAGSKISAYVPDVVGNSEGFFINPTALPFEISHLIEKNAEKTGGDYTESLRRFLDGRLNLAGRELSIFFTRNDFQQGKLRTGREVLGAMARNAVPVPLPASGLYRGGKELITGENEEKYPGQFQQQMMQSIGLKTDRVPTPEQRMRSLAKEFNREKGIVPNAEFYHGDYYELENALRLDNKREMREAMDELLHKKNKVQIYKHFQTWLRAPFTGQMAREAAFKRTLTEEQRAAYDKARQSRLTIARKAFELLRTTQPAELETVE